VALITGGSGALATALRTALSDAGWIVHAPDRSTLDVTSRRSVEGCFAVLKGLDLLVNCAGIRRDALVARQPSRDRDAVLDVCLRGAFLCSREAARIMSRFGDGHIVNIGSASALTGPAGQSAYAAAKAALIAFTKSIASELGPSGIRANCVLPGWMHTPMTAGLPAALRQQALDTHVLGRCNTPNDAARFIVFLHSLPAVSGQVFSLDSRILR
jgi:3-oxoacyl-[acyl-carrier protein] reductase